ncbi:hypothetical protein DEO72_LG6g2028 [Vigna unguiculata]|uniref:Uncharacterized protein n=1 Tax=Vigna unguiculata TaxID=3917 RepID=A0A4D6MA94_VIGUN|nr:hypothetical protein DEO72_LG6g2028 [Vigna unguiculata]
MPQESTQPPPHTPYQHVGSSSYVQQPQYRSFGQPGFQPLPFPPYLDASQPMSSHTPFQQVPYTYNMFPQQPDTFSGPTQNVFATSSSTPPSAYPTSFQQYYRPIMPPQMVEDINQRQQHEDNDDDDPVQSPQLRPRRHRRRPPCGTGSHR